MTTIPTIQQALTQTLLHSLWQIAVLGLIAAVVLDLMRRRTAALKHLVGMLFLIAMLAAPLTTFNLLMADTSDVAPLGNDNGILLFLMPVMLNLPSASSSSSTLLLPWIWFAGVAFMLVRLLGGWWMLSKLDHQKTSELPAMWLRRAESIRIALGIRRQVTIRLLESIGMPCTARAWRPIVWLPVSILTQLTPDQIEALLAHELAHVRRLDWVWNSLQCVVEAVLFYHPAVWWLNRRVRQERENACDDLAVAVCGDAIVLAEALARLEQERKPVHMLAISANGGSLMQRITRLLSPETPAKIRWGVPMGLMALVFSGVLLAAQANEVKGDRSIAEAASWWSSVGNSTEIHEHDDGVRRVYRKWIDLSGDTHETYQENGKAKPIDKNVRQWLKQQQAAMPPAPPEPPAPPAPPAPPSPPSITSSEAFKAAVLAVQKDAGSVKMLGDSIVAESVGGPSYFNDDEATFVLVMSGSKARANVQVSGEKVFGKWRFTNIDLATLESSAK